MFNNLLSELPSILISLPMVLLSLSVHEAAHAYAAHKLGDDTAMNMGRLTLNPLKHIHPIGFLSMLFFRVGWANPVPISTRNFKNPRRDMAISSAAGPASNLCLALILTVLLRLLMIPISSMLDGLYYVATDGMIYFDPSIEENPTFLVLSILALMLYLGIGLNLNLMLFNLIPLPPLDGSRVAYIFLPTDLYFKIMQYERYIMIAFIVLLATDIIDLPLSLLSGGIQDFFFLITGMPENELSLSLYQIISRFQF